MYQINTLYTLNYIMFYVKYISYLKCTKNTLLVINTNHIEPSVSHNLFAINSNVKDLWSEEDQMVVEQDDVELTSPHKHIKNTSTGGPILMEN